MKRIAVFLFLSILICFSFLSAQDRAGLTVLTHNFSVRASGMGGAFTGLADDVSGMFYNPAGLGRIGKSQFSAIHDESFGLVPNDTLLHTFRTWGGNWAFLLNYNYSSPVNIITSGIETGDDVLYHNLMAGFGYGRRIYKWFYGGINLRYDAEFFDQSFQQAILIDTGMQFVYDLDSILPGFDPVSLGMALLNIMPGSLVFAPERTDFRFRTGLSTGYGQAVRMNLDLDTSKDLGTLLRWGWEVFPFYFLSLRTGIIMNGPGTGILDRLTFGAGIGNSIGKGRLAFNIAYSRRNIEGGAVQMGINWVFDSPYYYSPVESRIQQRVDEEQAEQDREQERSDYKEERRDRKEESLEQKRENREDDQEEEINIFLPDDEEQSKDFAFSGDLSSSGDTSGGEGPVQVAVLPFLAEPGLESKAGQAEDLLRSELVSSGAFSVLDKT